MFILILIMRYYPIISVDFDEIVKVKDYKKYKDGLRMKIGWDRFEI